MSFSNLRKVPIHYEDSAVQSMISLIKTAPFPARAPIDPASPWTLGIDYDYLKDLKHRFENEWKWSDLEKSVNKFDHFLVDYASTQGDQLQLHFVHQRSERADAIPLLLLHGWPGTFYDFHKVIEPLVNPKDPKLPAFHVVVPSIPGYFLSTLPRRDGWNLEDVARLYNDLAVKLLGYRSYTAQGGDWGSMIARIMAYQYPESLLAVHLNIFIAPQEDYVDSPNLSETENKLLARGEAFARTGMGYFNIQSTKPFTIGIAIGSSPLAVLAYIGEKIHDWSDPTRVDPQDIVDTVALYYLSSSFATSVVIYNQAWKDPAGTGVAISARTLKVKSKALGVSMFPYEIGGTPRASIEKYGNLTFYKEHEAGGHFPALDSSDEFIADLREFFGQNFA
ncbi:alpha/beta-hydrolase [Irpex lacteus]|nr:alpha/beta-hydrolase [Irpex lacteus]